LSAPIVSGNQFKCPKGCSDRTFVVDSRVNGEGTYVRRRRRCEGCRYVFTTFELQCTPEEFRAWRLNGSMLPERVAIALRAIQKILGA